MAWAIMALIWWFSDVVALASSSVSVGSDDAGGESTASEVYGGLLSGVSTRLSVVVRSSSKVRVSDPNAAAWRCLVGLPPWGRGLPPRGRGLLGFSPPCGRFGSPHGLPVLLRRGHGVLLRM